MYATATSVSQLTAPVNLMSRIMFGAGASGLALAVILSWMASKQMYRPISRLLKLIKGNRQEEEPSEALSDEVSFIEIRWNHLTQETREIENRLKQAYPSLRIAFLMQLVQGHFYSLTEAEVRERMQSFGWEAEEDWYTLILLQISGVSRETGRFRENDEQLATFAASNITQEVIMNRSKYAESINFQDLTVGIILSYSQILTKQQVKEELYGLAEDLMLTVSSLLKMQTTICIGNVVSEVKELSQMLPYLRNTIKYRDLQGNSQVLDLEEMVPGISHPDLRYPFELERKLVQVIRIGQTEQALELIQIIIHQLTLQTGNEKLLKEGALQLLGSILHTMLEAGFYPHDVFGGQNLYERLEQLREPEQIVSFLQQEVIAPYTQRLNEHQDHHLKLLVEQVAEHMKQRFTSDISLEECADTFGVTPYALSRAFKQVYGFNYIDYLTDLRINKAKELLNTSDLKINEIAEYVGYQTSYFIRLFKKMEGVTPGKYREHRLN
jgi:AraC-like DNA-binding protein